VSAVHRFVAAAACAVTLLGVAAPASAQDAPPAPPEAADDQDARSRVAVRFNVDWLNAARFSSLAEGTLNPGNARLWLPQQVYQSDVRANVRVEFGSRAQLIVRPRVRGAVSLASAEGQARREDGEADAEWTELYGTWIPSDAVAVTWGLQNFQWGPAELLAPNNRIFHESGLFRDPIYYVRGKHLLRVNLSAGRQWSVVVLGEVGATDAEPFRAGEAFARQILGKAEYTTASGASYVGLTVGATDGTPPWFGGYGSLAITEGLSVYADTSHTRGSQAWYPVAGGTAEIGDGKYFPTGGKYFPSPISAAATMPPTFARTRVGDDAWTTLAVFGARYTFARGDDLRVEWLMNGAGWTRDELRLAYAAALVAPSPEAFAPYLAPGLEYIGRRFVYVSLRDPDLPPSKRTQVQSRYLHSLTDGSRVFFVTGSFDATDAMVLFASATVTGGPVDGEFSRIGRGSIVVGATYTW
jgi:hypothetical protein